VNLEADAHMAQHSSTTKTTEIKPQHSCQNFLRKFGITCKPFDHQSYILKDSDLHRDFVVHLHAQGSIYGAVKLYSEHRRSWKTENPWLRVVSLAPLQGGQSQHEWWLEYE